MPSPFPLYCPGLPENGSRITQAALCVMTQFLRVGGLTIQPAALLHDAVEGALVLQADFPSLRSQSVFYLLLLRLKRDRF